MSPEAGPSMNWLEQLLADSGVIIGIVAPNGEILELAPRAPDRRWVATTLSDLVHADDRASVAEALTATGAGAGGTAVTTACRMRAPGYAWSEGSVTVTRLDSNNDRLGLSFEPYDGRARPGLGRERPDTAEGAPLGVSGDALTGLPGREHLLARLARLLPDASESSQVFVAVIDLDHFRLLNGSIGPVAGDTIILRTAERLADLSRPDGTVTRLGGDEFGLVYGGVHDLASAARLARRLLQVLAAPLVVGNDEVSITASIGLVLCSGDREDDAGLVLRDADTAQWQARQRGGGRYEFYLPGPPETAAPRAGVIGRMHRSISRSELELLFQPVAELSSGQFVDAEALIRWNHPDYGLLLPDEFIPAAEQTGFIVELGTWAIEQACREVARWTEMAEISNRLDRPPRVSVNVSTLQIGRPGFAAVVRDAITTCGLDPDQLGLEITESALMADLESSTETLWQLRSDGVRILADDFGTGYSSLAYLSRLPLDALKIDKSFVSELDRGSTSEVLVRGIVELARSLGIAVIAEGVETLDQLRALRSMECDLAQGYLLAYPAPADEVGPLLGSSPPALRGRRAS